MKCPECWAEKAYRRNEKGPWAGVLRCLLFIPMRCRHCYHKFWVHRLFAFGQVIEAPAKPQLATPPEKSTVAAQFIAQQSDEGTERSIRRRAA
jgi:hypothetical protein